MDKELFVREIEGCSDIPVGQKLAEKNYVPEASYTYQGSQLLSIHAELYVTGAYLTCTWQIPEGGDEGVWQFVDMMNLTDGQGNAFEVGISLQCGFLPLRHGGGHD